MFEQIEQIRKEGVRNVLIASAAALVLLCIFPFFWLDDAIPVLMIGFFVSVVIIAIIAERAKKKFLNLYKQTFLKSVLEQTFEHVRTNFEEGFSEDEIHEGHLITLYDRFHSDDYIAGTYNGVDFECSDIKIEDVVRSGKTTTVITRFQGLYLKVHLKRRFSGWTVVREREFLDNGNPRSFWSDMPELERITVESEEFNQKFSIYTSDGAEAFYLLTPPFMEKMMTLEKCYEGRCYFGFLNGQLHIAIDSREDHFDSSLFEKVDEYKISQHQNEINMIKGIVELVSKECE